MAKVIKIKLNISYLDYNWQKYMNLNHFFVKSRWLQSLLTLKLTLKFIFSQNVLQTDNYKRILDDFCISSLG
jgi:hypothetical protein